MLTIYGPDFKPVTRFATDTSDLADLAVRPTPHILQAVLQCDDTSACPHGCVWSLDTWPVSCSSELQWPHLFFTDAQFSSPVTCQIQPQQCRALDANPDLLTLTLVLTLAP